MPYFFLPFTFPPHSIDYYSPFYTNPRTVVSSNNPGKLEFRADDKSRSLLASGGKMTWETRNRCHCSDLVALAFIVSTGVGLICDLWKWYFGRFMSAESLPVARSAYSEWRKHRDGNSQQTILKSSGANLHMKIQCTIRHCFQIQNPVSRSTS